MRPPTPGPLHVSRLEGDPWRSAACRGCGPGAAVRPGVRPVWQWRRQYLLKPAISVTFREIRVSLNGLVNGCRMERMQPQSCVCCGAGASGSGDAGVHVPQTERKAKTVKTSNQKLLAWVAEVEAMCQPDRVEWVDGSKAEYDRLMQLMVDSRHGDQAERDETPQQLLVPQ